jgi:hypothetical protein
MASEVFNKNSSFMDAPGGETEDVAAMKAAGFSGVFCNVHSYESTKWTTLRNKCKAAGLFCGPWARVANDQHKFDSAILDHLISVADSWEQSFIVNAEVELTDTGTVRTSEIANKVGGRDAAVSTLPWLQNPPSVDWKPIGHLPVLLQIFPVEQPGVFPPGSVIEKQVADCRHHAHDCGIKCVYLTFGTYRGMEADWFKLQEPYSLFTGNEVGAKSEWAKWKPTSKGYVACKEVPAPVPTPTPWYKQPYKKGKAIGPEKLPRVLKPPSKNDDTVMTGGDCLAMKRIASKAGRWRPWAPSSWDNRYNELIAMGKGTGYVGDSGIRGFQRQEGIPETGVVDDKTYQLMRRALIPTGPNQGDHILDVTAIKLINAAAFEFSDEGKLTKIRAAMTAFMLSAEMHEEVWHYTQARPFTGVGASPESSHFNDCSSYVILVYHAAWQATGIFIPDPSGYRYTGYGNTWDNLDGHERITSGNYLVGDLAHYDGHVTICKKGGSATTSEWSSFGTESGPREEPLYYRPDFIKVVRPRLL